MNGAMGVAAVSLLAVWLVACGGGGGGNPDEAAIEDMVEQLFQGFEDGDAALLASLFGEECGDMTADAEAAIAIFEDRGDIELDFDGVSIQNLTETTAEFLPQGTVKSEGQEAPLSEPDEPYTAAVKENGAWKISECELFL